MLAYASNFRGIKLTLVDIPQRIDDDSLGALHLDDLGSTVRRAAVINEPSNSTHLCRIDDRILIYAEEIAGTNTLHIVFDFAEIGNPLSDPFSNVLDNHVIGGDTLLFIQSPIVNGRAVELD